MCYFAFGLKEGVAGGQRKRQRHVACGGADVGDRRERVPVGSPQPLLLLLELPLGLCGFACRGDEDEDGHLHREGTVPLSPPHSLRLAMEAPSIPGGILWMAKLHPPGKKGSQLRPGRAAPHTSSHTGRHRIGYRPQSGVPQGVGRPCGIPVLTGAPGGCGVVGGGGPPARHTALSPVSHQDPPPSQTGQSSPPRPRPGISMTEDEPVAAGQTSRSNIFHFLRVNNFNLFKKHMFFILSLSLFCLS